MGEFIEEHARRAGRPMFGGAAVTATSSIASRSRPRSLPHAARRRVVEPPRDRRTSTRPTDALAFANSTWARGSLRAGHELSGSLPADAHLARCSSRGSRQRGRRRRCSSGSPSGWSTYREDYAAYYKSFADAGVAGAARLAIRRWSSFRASASSASARTSARRASRPSSSSTRST